MKYFDNVNHWRLLCSIIHPFNAQLFFSAYIRAPETNSQFAPENRPFNAPRGNLIVWTNHPFSGANWELLVSGRVTTLRPKNPWKNGRCWSLEMWVKQPNKSLELQRLEKNSSGFPGSSVSKLVANSNLKPRREAIATTDGRQMRLQSIAVS